MSLSLEVKWSLQYCWEIKKNEKESYKAASIIVSDQCMILIAWTDLKYLADAFNILHII